MRSSPIRTTLLIPALALSSVVLSGCISLDRLASPESEYSENANEAKVLQVPPDLTDISNGEQFILPGISGEAVSRNTLLPVFESAKFVRQANQSWLEINQSPEELWPRLLSFTRKKNYKVSQTRPVSGVIATDWLSSSEGEGFFKSLISKNAFSRIAFRLERTASGSRLFARAQQADEDFVEANRDSAWPAEAHAPENTSELLTELLVYFGIDEQKAKGILSESRAASLLDDATIQTTGGGSVLVMHKGYQPSFRSIQQALSADGYEVTRTDVQRGVLEATNSGETYLFDVAPVHVSASRVSVQGAKGERLAAEIEKSLLDKLREQLI